MRQTTIGWELLFQWNDGSKKWIDLKLPKESNPVQVVDYAVSCDIDDEPAFGWWGPYTLRNRDVIIAGINSRVKQTTHKYGIKVPKYINEAIDIDIKNRNTYWTDAINLEISNIGVELEVLGVGVRAPPGWIKASGRIICDVKTEFALKAIWVKDGHRTPDLLTSSYSGVL